MLARSAVWQPDTLMIPNNKIIIHIFFIINFFPPFDH